MKNLKKNNDPAHCGSAYFRNLRRKGHFGLPCFVLLGLLACHPAELTAEPKGVYKLPAIADVPTVVSTSMKMTLGARTLHVTLLYQSHGGRPLRHLYASHPPHFVGQLVRRSSYVMDDFLAHRGLSVRDCRGTPYNLIIYIVDKSVLSNQKRFGDIYRDHPELAMNYGQTLYGYYSSTPLVDRNSTILVTDVGHTLNQEVLAHEMSHYWWDRLCLNARLSETSEDFARAFDDYFMNRRHR